MRDKLIGARDDGIDISNIEDQYKGAEPAYNEGNFANVLDIISKTQVLLDEAVEASKKTEDEGLPAAKEEDDLESDLGW